MKDESGTTVIEMLAAIIGFVVIFGAIMEMTVVATHNQDRIAGRVAANQRARPTLTRVMDQIRSGCVAPRVVPVLQGSTSTQMNFISKTGSAVSPLPDRRELTFVPGVGTTPPVLREAIYPGTGGTPPIFTYSGTPNPNPPQNILIGVTPPPDGIGFRYYKYVNGQLSATPQAVPLNATTAAETAFVTVSMTVRPARGVSNQDLGSPITLSDSVDLRLESASQTTGAENLPCT